MKTAVIKVLNECVKFKLCTCKNEVQDNLYGKRMRLYNKCLRGYRCSVCGKEILK